MNRYFSTAGGLGGTTIFQAIILLSGIGSGVTQARALGPAGRGELALVLLWPSILIIFGEFGLSFAFSYYAGKEDDRLDQLWTLAILCGVFIGCAMALLGWFLIPEFVPGLQGSGQRSFGIALLSVPLILTSGYQAYLLLGKGHVADYSTSRLIIALVNLCAVWLIAGLGWASVRNFTITYILAQAAGCAASTWLIRRRFHVRFQLRGNKIPKLFSYGSKALLASVAAQTNLRADQAVMSIVLAASQLGQYVVAVSISGVLVPFLTASAITILPRTTLARSELSGALQTARHVKIACLLSLPVVVLSVLAMPYVLPLFFGAGYLPAVLPAQVLVVAGLFQGLNGILGNSLRGLGRPSWSAVAEALGMVLTIALLILLLPRLGILGAATASLAAYVIVASIQFVFVARAARVTAMSLASTPMGLEFLGRSRQFLRSVADRQT